jgi:hypothetical protein
LGGFVTLTRRNFLGAATAAAGAAALPARAFASVAAPQPAIDPILRARALAALQARRGLIRADVIGIADFSKASRQARFYILDLVSGFTTEHLVAHGRGSDPAHSGWLELFSNDVGSYATSEGAYLTGDAYTGKYGYSMRLNGLDPSNSNALAREIVIHTAWYAEPKMIDTYGKLGRSEGCFALPGVSHAEAMTRLGSGRLLYAEKA